MNDYLPNKQVEMFSADLEKELFSKYGPLVSGDDLRKLLGFPTMSAFRQALHRNNVEIPVFSLDNRRGKYALVRDVADWITKKRNDALDVIGEKTKKRRDKST